MLRSKGLECIPAQKVYVTSQYIPVHNSSNINNSSNNIEILKLVLLEMTTC
jgi:hypothetical protein